MSKAKNRSEPVLLVVTLLITHYSSLITVYLLCTSSRYPHYSILRFRPEDPRFDWVSGKQNPDGVASQ